MKYLFLSIFFVLLSGCGETSFHTIEDRIISISDTLGYPIGRWVLVNDEVLMTATHVFYECRKTACRYTLMSRALSVHTDSPLDIQGDRVLLSIQSLDESRYLLRYETPLPDMSIHALVSRSGSWSRIDGKILAIDQKYMAYDRVLSGRVFTWGIETDIVLEKGESGSPIWSNSGWLIGVMSAVDREGRRGWVVR